MHILTETFDVWKIVVGGIEDQLDEAQLPGVLLLQYRLCAVRAKSYFHKEVISTTCCTHTHTRSLSFSNFLSLTLTK